MASARFLDSAGPSSDGGLYSYAELRRVGDGTERETRFSKTPSAYGGFQRKSTTPPPGRGQHLRTQSVTHSNVMIRGGPVFHRALFIGASCDLLHLRLSGLYVVHVHVQCGKPVS